MIQFHPAFGLMFPQNFELEPSSIDREAMDDLMGLLRDLYNDDQTRPLEGCDSRIDHALMLFYTLVNDPRNAYDGLTPTDLFTACLDTVMVWDRG